MISPRLLPRTEWEHRLRQRGCKPADKDSEPKLETGEWWLTKHDFLFPVACDENGYLRLDDWLQIEIILARLKPIDWNTY